MNILQKISLQCQNNLAWPSDFILPSYQSHRGYIQDMSVRENTMKAFESSREKGYRMIECDVRLTQDKVPILLHDMDAQRVFGTAVRPENARYDELKKMQGLTTLEELLVRNKEFKFALNIEIKSEQSNDPIVRHLIHLIAKYKYENKMVLSSFNPYVLYMLQNYLPSIPRALLATDQDEEGNRFLLKNLLFLPTLKVHALHLYHGMITTDLMAMAMRKKLPIVAWTVNDASRANELFALGVKSIITDKLLE